MTTANQVEKTNLKAFCERLYRYLQTLEQTRFYSVAPNEAKDLFEYYFRTIKEYFDDSDTLDVYPNKQDEFKELISKCKWFSNYSSLNDLMKDYRINLDNYSLKSVILSFHKSGVFRECEDSGSYVDQIRFMYCALELAQHYIWFLMRYYHSKIDFIPLFVIDQFAFDEIAIFTIITDLTMLLLAIDNPNDEWSLANQFQHRNQNLIIPGIQDKILDFNFKKYDALEQSNFETLTGGKNGYSLANVSYTPVQFEMILKAGLIMNRPWAITFYRFRKYCTLKTYLPIHVWGLTNLLREMGLPEYDNKSFAGYGFEQFRVIGNSKSQGGIFSNFISMEFTFDWDMNSDRKKTKFSIVFRYKRPNNIPVYKYSKGRFLPDDVVAVVVMTAQVDPVNGGIYFKPIAFNSNMDFKGYPILDDRGKVVSHVEAFQKFILFIVSKFGTDTPEALDCVMTNATPIRNHIDHFSLRENSIFDYSENRYRSFEEQCVKWHYMGVDYSDFTERNFSVEMDGCVHKYESGQRSRLSNSNDE